MKIVSFETARVTWLFPLEEFAPPAGTNSPAVLSQIALRYGFTITPNISTRDDMAKNGLVFGMGRFEYEGKPFVVTDFAVYNDGLAAVAEKTEWADAFLDDVTAWVKKEFGFREILSGIRKLYASTIVVDFEASPSRLVRDLKRIADFISDRSVTISGDRKQLEFSRLDFEADKLGIAGQVAVPKFILERRAAIRFAQERYYSNAPMRTADHLETLEEIERVAASA